MDRVNGYVQGVQLETSGQAQRVVLEYRPESLLWGAWISGLGVLLTVVLLIRKRLPVV